MNSALKILAIDPGATTGWAHSDGPFGTWDLSVRRDESGGMPLLRLTGKLFDVFKSSGIDLIVFEAARHAMRMKIGGKVINTEVTLVKHAEIQGVIKTWCGQQGVEYRGYSPAEIKKFATGKGNSNKAEVIRAAMRVTGSLRTLNEHEADAICILALARADLSIVKP